MDRKSTWQIMDGELMPCTCTDSLASSGTGKSTIMTTPAVHKQCFGEQQYAGINSKSLTLHLDIAVTSLRIQLLRSVFGRRFRHTWKPDSPNTAEAFANLCTW